VSAGGYRGRALERLPGDRIAVRQLLVVVVYIPGDGEGGHPEESCSNLSEPQVWSEASCEFNNTIHRADGVICRPWQSLRLKDDEISEHATRSSILDDCFGTADGLAVVCLALSKLPSVKLLG
jgi:hypothetical protein